tara:strand:- start:136 stop:447 length:312 start_codon:yes stop_codon:yes gene_type:complete
MYLADEEPAGFIFVYNFPPFPINIVNFWLIPASRPIVTESGSIGQSRCLEESVRHVNPESIYTPVKPKPEYILKSLMHIRVMPIQVRLARIKHMEVPSLQGSP